MTNGLNPVSTFPRWLKQRRRSLDLTQAELAQLSGCSLAALRKIESGSRRPSKQLALLLAQALEIPGSDQAVFVRVARGELDPGRLRSSRLTSRLDFPSPGIYPDSLNILPLQASPWVGRSPEMSLLERLFSDPQCRLLTLTGLGGIGKTRLAIEFAATHQALFPAGVVYVSFASLTSPELIAPAIAEQMGLIQTGTPHPKEQLFSFLAHRFSQPLLLVLDNLEHLLLPGSSLDNRAGAAGFILEILQRLPDVKILATSRERLNLQGEWVFELHGLSLPPLEFAEPLEDYSASRLFLLTAQRVKLDFTLQPEERPALIRICRLLEGIPLAIELAAAWVGMFSCRQIAAEIEANLDFLTTSLRDVPERHRSIRATFDHSWTLLCEDERRTLWRLSVFQGEFSRQAAEMVSAAAVPVLASLHAKSLLRTAGEGRFSLHEVIRQYARTYLDLDPQREEIYDRHSQYFLGLLKDREHDLKSAAQKAALHELAGEIDNLRAAWTWAIERGRVEWVGEALRSYGWLCEIAGWLQEGIDQLELLVQALRSADESEGQRRILGTALSQQGLLSFRKGQFDRSRALWEESLQILRSGDDPDLLVDPLVFAGILAHIMGDFDGARLLMTEGLQRAHAAGDRWFETYASYNLGYLDSLSGEYTRGYERMLAAIASWRELGDPSSIALGLNYISPTAVRLGHTAQAKLCLKESIALCTQVGERWGLGTAYRFLGLVAMAEGNAAEAQSMLLKSLEIFGAYIEGWDIACSLAYLGEALLVAGDLHEARQAFSQSLRVAVEAQSPPLALEALLGLARLMSQVGQLELALEIGILVCSHTASTHSARESASRLVADASRALDELTIQVVRERALQRTRDPFSDEELQRAFEQLVPLPPTPYRFPREK